MGLLSKAGNLETSKFLAFSDFVKKYKFKFCAVFEKKGVFFLIRNSIGFDGASIISSYSTADFWDGLCDIDETLCIFSKENGTLNPLLQLFSFAQKDDIESVSVLRFAPDRFFVACNQNISKDIISDLQNLSTESTSLQLQSINHLITRESKVLKFQVDFLEATESFIKSQIKDKKKSELFLPAILNEISNRFLCYFAKDVSCNINAHTVRAVFVVTRELTQDHLINHIILNLSGVIGKYSDIINFSALGIAKSLPEIKDFLQA